jgi:NADP-dependent 3-hydroxy acid dehydrogenase YdfG
LEHWVTAIEIDVFDLGGKSALVTGASSGFGTHFAAVLAKAGANVLLAGRRVEALNEVATEIRKTARGHVAMLELDVTNPASVDAASEHLKGSTSS